MVTRITRADYIGLEQAGFIKPPPEHKSGPIPLPFSVSGANLVGAASAVLLEIEKNTAVDV